MKKIAVLSGKGGTGKTSVTAAFGFLAGKSAVLCDCDVDASNLPLVTLERELETQEFSGGQAARIDPLLCISCGKCQQVCRFESVLSEKGVFSIQQNTCEGCAYCTQVCPVQAVIMEDMITGLLKLSSSRFGSYILSADLRIGAENSGKLTSQVKKLAEETARAGDVSYMIIDGPPGLSCPAIATVSGVDLVVFVVESSRSGYADYVRAHEMVRKMGLKTAILVNKCDLNPDVTVKFQEIAAHEGTQYLGEIPYDSVFGIAVNQFKTVTEIEPAGVAANVLKKAWQSVAENNGR